MKLSKGKKELVFGKKDVVALLNTYSISLIESALVELFLEKRNMETVKNSFLSGLLKFDANTTKIKELFKERSFEPDIKNIERVFELLIPESDRQLNGAFYTPQSIVEYMVKRTVKGDVTVCDPAAGSGAFLIETARHIHTQTKKPIIKIIEENLYGVDILPYNITRCKILLTLLALENNEDHEKIDFNLKVADSLTINWETIFPRRIATISPLFENDSCGFDVIISNPPYVRIQDLPVKSREAILKRWATAKNGNFNIYFGFFELGLQLLNKNGKLAFIVPNNYFTSLAAEKLRAILQEGKYISEILDFNHLLLFEDATTYTCITVLDKAKRNQFQYALVEDYSWLPRLTSVKFSEIRTDDLNEKKWRLLMDIDKENIEKIETAKHRLGDVALIHSGVATLKDEIYLVDGRKSDGIYFLKSYSGKEYQIEKGITRKMIKISNMMTDSDIDKNTLRIIFPYEKAVNGYKPIPEDNLKKHYPRTYAYLLAAKKELGFRDKGKAKQLSPWYQYGRSQGLEFFGQKIVTPTFAKRPRFMYDKDPDSLFCNGYAIFSKDNGLSLRVLQKILNSAIMEYYIKRTSVAIEGAFMCFQKNFIELFGIPEFNSTEISFLENEDDVNAINDFLIRKYGLDRAAFKHAKILL